MTLVLLLLLTDKQEGKHVGNKGDHDDHRSAPHSSPLLLRRIVGIRRQDEPRELVMLEGSDRDLRVLVDQRESLSLVEESELVDSVHVRHLDDLFRIPSSFLRWSSPHRAGRRRRSNSCARRGPASQTPPAYRPSTSLPLRNAHLELAPLLAIPLLHIHRVVERVLHAVDHVVPRDLRLAVAR